MNYLSQNLGLSSDNSIVIGSGILQALGIRQSKDVDIVVNRETFKALKKLNKFAISESHGHEILSDEMFEIGTDWNVLGKEYELEDLKKESTVIDGIRYITLDFLYKVKKSWEEAGNAR